MGQGYVRNDTSNNIADNNVINAADFDGEFDAVVAAFAASTGHSHDGTTGEGGPVTVLGPAQDWVATGAALYPKNDNTYDIGQAGNELRDIFVDRFAYIDGLVVQETATFAGATVANLGTVTTADINGGTIDGTVIGGASAANGTFTNIVGNFVRVSSSVDSILDLKFDTDPSTHQRTRFTRVAGSFRMQTRNEDASAFTNDMVATVGASGISNWKFNTNGTLDFELDSVAGASFAVPVAFNSTATFGTMVFNSPSSVVTALGFTQTAAAISGGIIPSGGIIMWSGSVASIPAGWALCNGSNGTPDLRDRFLVGAGGAYSVGATGGADSVTLSTTQIPSHTHTFSGSTSSGGDHTHSGSSSVASLTGSFDIPRQNTDETDIITNATGVFTTGEGSTTNLNKLSNTGPAEDRRRVTIDASHFHTLSIVSGGAHSHTFSGTSGATGSGSSHENRPPYYALAYIMKL